jgi:Lon protease-like protein
MFQKFKDRIANYLSESADLEPFELPLFPLNTVLFPGGVLPLRVFEQRYIEMTKACLRDDTPFGVCCIKEGAEVGAPSLPHEVGCLARITDWDMQQLGVLNLKTVGLRRFRILETRVEPDNLIIARAQLLPREAPMELPPEHAACAGVLKHIIERAGEANFEPPLDYNDAVWVSYRLAEVLPIKLSAKQNMLEMNDTKVRLEVLHRFLGQQGLST